MSDSSRRIAIIDLGTNTFNLLIAEIGEESTWSPIFTSSIPVKLGQGGMARNAIAWDRFVRGVDAMIIYQRAIANYRCAETHAYATSAVREASNGKEFTDAIKAKTGITVKVIGGQVEAELIHTGVVQSIPDLNTPLLIMDIGGGSTEFIVSHQGEIKWKESFPLGVARMAEILDLPDPMGKAGKVDLEKVLQSALEPLWAAVKEFNPQILVGASGSFNTFKKMLAYQQGLIHESSESASVEFSIPHFKKMTQKLIDSEYIVRLKMQGMHPMRADSIQLSAIFASFMIEKLNIQKLYQSDFALKEGVLHRIIHN